jgi:hypothetical protein
MPSSWSFVLRLIELAEVEAAHSEQLLVRTLLAELALVHDEDSVSLSSFRYSLRQIRCLLESDTFRSVSPPLRITAVRSGVTHPETREETGLCAAGVHRSQPRGLFGNLAEDFASLGGPAEGSAREQLLVA